MQPHPILVLARGIPGSGKSFLARYVQEKIGKDEIVLLDPDAIDFESDTYKNLANQLREQGVDEKFYPYRSLRANAYSAIESGKIIIWNQAFTNLDGFQKTVINLQSYAKERGIELPLLVVEVFIDPALAKERVQKRAESGGHDVTDEAFERFINDFRSFADEGYQTVTVSGEQDASVSAQKIIEAINTVR